MILKVTGLDHLNLSVKNLDESVEFYNKLFGFRVLKEQPEQNSKIIGSEKVKLCLYEVKDVQISNDSGFNHFGFHVENFSDVIQKCKEMNVEIFYGGAIEWEKSASIYIADPNGYEIELSKIFGGGI